jgi:hypothetical protein
MGWSTVVAVEFIAYIPQTRQSKLFYHHAIKFYRHSFSNCTMDISQLSVEELQQLRTLAQRLQSFSSPPAHSLTPPSGDPIGLHGPLSGEVHAASAVPRASPSVRVDTPMPQHPALTSMRAPIAPYQSVRSLPPAAQGHPSLSRPESSNTITSIVPYQSARNAPPTAPGNHFLSSSSVSSTSTQPFLGFDTLSPPILNQTNQRRLNSAAAHIPRQPRLQSRGRRRGPAIAPPSMPRPPSVNDCLIDLLTDAGTLEPGIRIKAKVYPPQVSPKPAAYLLPLIILIHTLGDGVGGSVRIQFHP